MENLPESPFLESTLISSPSLCNISSSHADMQQNSHDLDGLTPNQLVLLLHDNNLRGEVMYQLIKKRDTCEDLALLLWNTFNAVYMLLLEVISVYWKLSPPMISMKESTRACNALALFQVMAKNPETRKELIEAKIPCYFYPFLKPCEDHDEPLEHVRITTLGVLGDLTKFDDPYGSHALHFFLESEVVPLCLKCMDVCDEMSRKVATLIVMNILTQERGLTYCCATPERFFAIVQVLRRVVEKLSPKPCLLHLEYVIQCYVCLSKIFRSIGPCDAFVRQIPPQLFDNTFRRTLLHDHEASWMLQVLHLNIYGCLYFPPIEERKKIAKKAASSSASSSKGKGKGKK
ncbi:hypothetical protein KY284_031798 [Solanum tuberosum]|nr:hypothetical protein KY284_031798 [Solanum tuberosum]